MLQKVLSLGVVILLLASCNLPTKPSSPTPDVLATQVATMLTPNGSEPVLATATPDGIQPTSTFPARLTDTPAPTATKQVVPTANPTLSVTLDPNDPRRSLGAPTWQDKLETSKNFYQYETDNTKVSWESGALLLTGIQANGWHGWSLTHSQKVLNFYLEATLIPQDCKGSDLYGLIFHATDTSGYFFGASCDGRYNLHARNFDDGSDKIITEMTQTAAIISGANQPNRLGVMVAGNKITLYANGKQIGEATDDTFKDAGYFGAFVAANETPGFTVKMDEISVWALP